jgi:hypothetical protein
VGIVIRIYGINWDQNQHLHPDERFLTMVATDLKWTSGINEYFNTNKSTLNPHNQKYGFYVYGTYPIHLVKAVSTIFNKDNYQDLVIIGRAMSALVDTFTALLVLLIALTLTKNKKIGLLSLYLYISTTLCIQLSHFFAVDPYLTFFLTLTLYLLVNIHYKNNSTTYISTAVAFALAVAAKISALYITPVLITFFLVQVVKEKNKFKIILLSLSSILVFAFVLRISFPYLFLADGLVPSGINQKVLDNWKELNHYYSWNTYTDIKAWIFPPAVLFLSAKPYITPFLNLFTWGLGIPLGVLATLATLWWLFTLFRQRLTFFKSAWYLIFLWVVVIFIIQGQQFLLYLRYFYPLIPPLTILSAHYLSSVLMNKNKIIICLILFFILIWPTSFINIYSQPHSRVTASRWIYKNIPEKSKISFELWDDPLPLYVDGKSSSKYEFIELPLYDQDTPEKWMQINSKLSKLDYLILSSNRLYGSISGVPNRYPITSKFYKDLFEGNTQFTIDGVSNTTSFNSNHGYVTYN